MNSPPPGQKNTLYCSFCGKSQHEVKKLICGPTAFICNECAELCVDMAYENDRDGLAKHLQKVAGLTPLVRPVLGALVRKINEQEQAIDALQEQIDEHVKELSNLEKLREQLLVFAPSLRPNPTQGEEVVEFPKPSAQELPSPPPDKP